MFGFSRKRKTATPEKTVGSLLTCPDDQFEKRFSALWDSLKDENGEIHLHITKDDLITTDRMIASKLTANTLVVPDKTM